MRPIKFRGKRVDNGEWVYGYFRKVYSGHYQIMPHPTTSDDHEWFTVIPETVGQYTGLKDKNGVKGYYQDMTEDENSDKYLVEWDIDEGIYYLKALSLCVCDKELYAIKEQKIIGNIHENPELFGAKL